MSCHNCSSQYGILKREVGCDVCGFSFCTKCCNKKNIPSKTSEGKKQLICIKCFDNLTSNKASNTSTASPPLAHKKRMATFKKQSYSVDSGSEMPSFSSQWSNDKDKEMAERLQRLKRERKKDLILPSEMEIEERLAKLKGMDPAKYNAPPIMVYRPAEKLSSVEQAANLMKQLKEEVDIDSKLVKPEDEIAARLARLKNEDVPRKKNEETVEPAVLSAVEHSDQSEEMDVETAHAAFQKEYLSAQVAASQGMKELSENEEIKNLLASAKNEKEMDEEDQQNEEEETNKLIEKLMAANIDDEMAGLESLNHTQSQESEENSESTPAKAEEEFPWCVICTENAKMRCFGCDGDLYCMRCFKECHDSLDIKDHKTCPYFPPKDPLE